MTKTFTTKLLLPLKQNYKSLFWAIIILFLSVARFNTSDTIKELLIPHSDKLVHIFLYTIFSFLLLLENKKSKGIFIRLLFSLFYGILMELFQQYFTTYRSFEVTDILANFSGSIIGSLLFKIFNKKLKS
ncbi:MAG: hypothetical protein DRJ10_00165 [Bacteroidetes bacterium]|nr:MAG: hypothetical protein DRJ10_00040 [Bacteroidota bacterium]RLD84845.1 MAG: hypothetical protein DRJ10_00165 [Bacteroidota bacterium]RLD86059.1 MAG: hypothetical protein DRJ07_01675 [Bacteroidota bacterium]